MIMLKTGDRKSKIIIHINIFNVGYKVNKIYREKSIPMTAFWCPARIQ